MKCPRCGYTDEKRTIKVNPNDIIDYITQEEGVTISEIRQKNNKPRYAYIRYIIAFMLKRYSKLTVNEIGSYLNRDHSSITHGIKQIRNPFLFDLRIKYTKYNFKIKKMRNEVKRQAHTNYKEGI